MFIDIGARDGFLHKTGLRTSPNQSALTPKRLTAFHLPMASDVVRECITDVQRRAANTSKYSLQPSSLFQNVHRVKSWLAFECNYLEDKFVFPEVELKIMTINGSAYSTSGTFRYSALKSSRVHHCYAV